jgi:hypothetical protein
MWVGIREKEAQRVARQMKEIAGSVGKRVMRMKQRYWVEEVGEDDTMKLERKSSRLRGYGVWMIPRDNSPE